MLWEYEPTGECFHSFHKLLQVFQSITQSIETQRTFFQFYLQNTVMRKRKQFVQFNHYNLMQREFAFNVNSLCSLIIS